MMMMLSLIPPLPTVSRLLPTVLLLCLLVPSSLQASPPHSESITNLLLKDGVSEANVTRESSGEEPAPFLEGSGVQEGRGPPTPPGVVQLETASTTVAASHDALPLLSTTVAHSTDTEDYGTPRSRFMSTVEKRASAEARRNHKLGSLPLEVLVSYNGGGVPPSATLAFGRPLKRGGVNSNEYIGVAMTGDARLWGRVYQAGNSLTAEFVDLRTNSVVYPQRQNMPFRILALPSNAADLYNVGVAWVLARDVDPLAIVVQVNTRGYYKKYAAAVYLYSPQEEYVGVADVENQLFSFIDKGQVHTVRANEYQNKVYVMVKTTCSCSCPASASSNGFFANIKDFFG